jgi:predicted DNA-binding transcriptional regulator YafY
VRDALDTPARLLRLLSLLQQRPFWRGEELSDRLAITPRTVRRDIARLRALGYPIDASPGPLGGYQLGAGGSLPPLLLDDDEAVAVAVGLRTAAGGSVVGLEEAALAAHAKLEQVLPSSLHHRVAALSSTTIELPPSPPGVDPGSLVTLAQACRGLERLRFSYRDGSGRDSERTVEPYRLVHAVRNWYLVARDVRREAWRTFRVDRIRDAVGTGHRFTIDDPPDAAALVARGMAVGAYQIQARVHVHAPADEISQVVPRTVAVIEARTDGTTVLIIGGDSLGWLAGYLASLPFALEVLDPEELRAELRALGLRLAAAHR